MRSIRSLSPLACRALLFLACALGACRNEDRPVVFPPEDGAVGAADGGKDAATSADASSDKDAATTDGGVEGKDGGESDAQVNHLPTAPSFSLSTDEDTAISDTLAGSDEDGDTLSYEVVGAPKHGKLVLDEASGDVTYTPDQDFNGADAFTFRVSDGKGESGAIEVDIDVLPVNDAPVLAASSLNVDEDDEVDFTLEADDVDGDALEYEVVSAPLHGVVDGIGLALTYTPDANYNGSDSFEIRVGDGDSTSSTVTIDVDVAPTNDGPDTTNDTATVAEGGTVTLLTGSVASVLANDSDLEGDAITANTSLFAAPLHGTATIAADGTFSYTHDGSESSSDTFTYRACDAGTPSLCSNGVVVVTITPVNDAPVAQADAISVAEGGTLAAAAPGVLANDSDAEGEAIIAVLISGPTHGTLTLSPDGSVQYVNDGGEATSDSFVYQACQQAATSICSADATVAITITPVNDAPLASGDAYTLDEAATLTVPAPGLLANDSDADPGTALATTRKTQPLHGTVTVNGDGSFTYVHDGSESTSDSFDYEVCDDAASPLCVTATVTLTITALDDAPLALTEAIAVDEGDVQTLLVGGNDSVLANDTDAENDALEVQLVTPPAHTNAKGFDLQSDGKFTYVHDGSETTSDSFTYKACEQSSPTTCSSPIAVTVAITPVNDAPAGVADAITVSEGATVSTLSPSGTSVLTNDSDAESSALEAVLVTPPAHAVPSTGFVLDADGSFTYTHDGGNDTSDSFVYRACEAADPSSCSAAITVSITISPFDDAPVAAADAIDVAEAGLATALAGAAGDNLLGNDSDSEGDALQVTLVSGKAPTHASAFTLNADGTFSYTHDGSETSSDSFSYVACEVAAPAVCSGEALVTITVSPVNDAPLASADSIAVDEAATATTLSASGTSVLANDSDVEGASLVAELITPPAHAVPATGFSLATDGTFSYANDGSENASDSFTYRACEVGAPTSCSAAVTVTIAITLINEAPIALADTVNVGEGGTATVVATSLADSVLANDADPDGNPFSAVLVTAPAHAEPSTGFTLGADGKFEYVHDGSETTSDSFVYKACDNQLPQLCSANTTVTIAISAGNDAPVANDDSYQLQEGGGVSISDPATGLLANDSDADGPALHATLLAPPLHAAAVSGFTFNSDGTFAYTHDGSEAPTDSFTYTLCDGAAVELCDTATVTFSFVASDDAPIAVSDSASVSEDGGATAVDVLANDTDVDAGPMSIGSVTQPASGVVVITGGGTGLTYQPNASYCNNPPGTTPDTFTYTLNGGASAAVSVTVDCVDDAPVAVADSATVSEDASATAVDVFANDTDIDAGPKSVASVTQPANGTVVITGGGSGLTYQPNANYCNNPPGSALDTFTYTLAGGSSASVTITVNCVDDAPVAVDDSATVVEDSGATVVAVFGNDTDLDGGPKSIASVTQPANGTVAIIAFGTTLTYKPNADYQNSLLGTPDTFTYTLTGGSIATVSITVTNADDAPSAVADAATVAEDDAAAAIDVLANDTDIDGGPKSISSLTQPANGTVVITGGGSGLTYQPSANYCNNPPGSSLDTFSYTLDGGSSAIVSVTVTCADDAPVAVDDVATVSEDAAGTAVNVFANDTDIDGGPKSVASVTQPANGAVVITGGGSGLTYQPSANYCNDPPGTAPDTFTYTLAGGSSATVSVTVTCVDDAPVAVDDSMTVAEDSSDTMIAVLDNDTDSDGGPKSITDVTQPVNGTVTIVLAGTAVTYKPNADYQSSLLGGSDTFTYTLAGGSTATVSVTVTNVDDAPVAVADSATVSEDDAATALVVLGNDTDLDGGPMSIASVTQAANGAVVITGGGTGLTYQPNANYCNNPPGTTPDTFTYTLNGGSIGTVSVSVTCVDDVPVAVADSATVSEDAAATAVDVLGNDTDLDGGPKSIASVTQPANGAVVITGGGSGLTYEPNANYNNTPPGTMPDTFTYTLDGGSTGTVSVTVNAVNDAPVIATPPTYTNIVANTLYTVAAGGTVDSTTPVTSSLTDVEGDTVTVAVKTAPTKGTLTLGSDGFFTYLPNAGVTGSDSFVYTATDNGTPLAASTDVTINLTIGLTSGGRLPWYVDQNSSAATTGRSSEPFKTLAAAMTAASTGATATFYVKSVGTYTESITLASGQQLVGGGVAFSPSTSVTFSAGTRPAITSTGLFGVSFGGANSVSGIDVSTSNSAATAAAIAGTGSGAMSLSTMTISAPNAYAISLSGAGALTLTSLGSVASKNGVKLSGMGLSTAPGSGISLASSGGPVLDMNGGAIALDLTSLSSNASPTYGMKLNAVTGAADALKVSTLTVTNPTSDGVVISNASGSPTFDLGAASVTQAGTLGGATGDGYSFSSNSSGTTIKVDIKVDPNTANGRGLYASSAGTVTLTNALAPSLTSNGGPVVELDSTPTAAAGGWSFATLKATNTAAIANRSGLSVTATAQAFAVTKVDITGFENGIKLTNNGGASASFTLNTMGGSVSAGGSVKNSNGSGVLVTGSRNVTLDNLLVDTAGKHGIEVASTNGLTVRNSTITKVGDADDENGIDVLDPSGNVLLEDDVISVTALHSINVAKTSGSASLVVRSCDLGTNEGGTFCGGGSCGGDGLNVEVSGTGSLALLATGNTVADVDNEGVSLATTSNSAQLEATVTTNAFTSTSGDNDSAIQVNQYPGSTLRFDLDSNDVTDFSGALIAVDSGGDVNGTIHGNTLTSFATAPGNFGISVVADLTGGSTLDGDLVIENNVIRQVTGRGIQVIAQNGSGRLDTRIGGNDVESALPPLYMVADDSLTVCANIGVAGANTLDAVSGDDVRLREVGALSTFLVEGSGSVTSTIAATNTFPGTASINSDAGVGLTAVACTIALVAPTVPNL